MPTYTFNKVDVLTKVVNNMLINNAQVRHNDDWELMKWRYSKSKILKWIFESSIYTLSEVDELSACLFHKSYSLLSSAEIVQRPIDLLILDRRLL